MITPESPRYLCLKGRKEEALEVLTTIAKINGEELPPGVLVTDMEMEQKSSGTQDNEVDPQKWKDSNISVVKSITVLLSPKLIRTTLLLWLVFFGNAFAYYGLVLLTTQLNNRNSVCNITPGTHVQPQDSSAGINYRDVFITSFAGKFVRLRYVLKFVNIKN